MEVPNIDPLSPDAYGDLRHQQIAAVRAALKGLHDVCLAQDALWSVSTAFKVLDSKCLD